MVSSVYIAAPFFSSRQHLDGIRSWDHLDYDLGGFLIATLDPKYRINETFERYYLVNNHVV